MSDKKPRSDSKLDGLSESQRSELVRLLADGCSYKEALEWLDAECFISTTLSSLSSFYKRHVVPLIKERRDFAAAQAEAVASQLGDVDWDAASKEKLKQLTFRELNREDADAETVEKFTKLILKNHELEMNERKLKLLEKKAAQADEASGVMKNESLTDAEKAVKLKELFGISS